MAKPVPVLTSGFITPTALHLTHGLGEGEEEREVETVKDPMEEGVLCSGLSAGTVSSEPESKQAALIPRKPQWGEYKVLQGDLSSSKTHD